MISTARMLTAALLIAAGLNSPNVCRADGPWFAGASMQRLRNDYADGPYPSGCGRPGCVPAYNPGCWSHNPPGTGADDPWRPPHYWPQTRYPVVPAYTRPSFGYYETSWRLLPVQTCSACGGMPATLGAYPPQQPLLQQQPVQPKVPAAVPPVPAAVPPAQSETPAAPVSPQNAVPVPQEPLPKPEAAPKREAPPPKLKNERAGLEPNAPPDRAAMLEPSPDAEISVHAF